jgi:hypothetical protein
MLSTFTANALVLQVIKSASILPECGRLSASVFAAEAANLIGLIVFGRTAGECRLFQTESVTICPGGHIRLLTVIESL